MKAIILESPGGVENLIFKDIDQPSASEGEVLIKVQAISINPVDFKVRRMETSLNFIYGDERPAILGWDISGIVETVGTNVTQFKKGDRVFGMVNFPGAGKAYAEYVASPENQLAKIPEGISFEEAAATTLAALTALQVLESRIKKDDRVLIHAGSGGVGHFAIQIAKSLGAYVITTSSAKNSDFVMSLGADEHIDYQTHAFEEVLFNIDFVFDMFNGDILYNSIKVVKEGGTIVSIPTGAFAEDMLSFAKESKVTILNYLVQSSGKDMHTLKKMLENGSLKPHVSKTFPFAEMAQAHLQLESGRTVGKAVVTL